MGKVERGRNKYGVLADLTQLRKPDHAELALYRGMPACFIPAAHLAVNGASLRLANKRRLTTQKLQLAGGDVYFRDVQPTSTAGCGCLPFQPFTGNRASDLLRATERLMKKSRKPIWFDILLMIFTDR